jgi:putative tricarboxylic transport membrane protein
MKKRDILSSLFCLVIGVIFVIGSLSYSIWDRYGPGPGLFPLVLGLLFSILSLSLLLARGMGLDDKGEALTESDSLKPSEIYKTLIYLLLIVFFYFLFDRLGSVVTIFIFMAVVLAVLNKRSLRLSLAISFLSSLVVYVFFVRLLGVSLPGGILQNVIRFY